MSNIKDDASSVVKNMSDNQVEDALNNVLNNATISDDQIKEVMDVIKEEDTPEIKEVLNMPSNNGVKEVDENDRTETEVETKEVDVTVNPITGALQEKFEDSMKKDKNGPNLLDIDLDDLVDIPESIYDVPFDESLVENNLESYGITKDTKVITDLIALIKEYRSNRERNKVNWYYKMPDEIKTIINKNCVQVNNVSNSAKKMFAEALLDGLISDTGIDKMTIDLQESLAKAFDMSNFVSMTLDLQKSSFEEGIEKNILTLNTIKEKEEDEEKIQKINEKIDLLTKVRDAFIEAYQLNGLLDKLRNHKIKIKKIDIDKYGRHCENFLWKYKKDTPFIIKDITLCTPVLHRRFPEYTVEEVARFMIAFMKYTMNMKANNVVDHTFMSYFVSNIINIDFASTGTQEENAFVNLFCSNIERGIRLINGYDEYNTEEKEESNEEEEENIDDKSIENNEEN